MPRPLVHLLVAKALAQLLRLGDSPIVQIEHAWRHRPHEPVDGDDQGHCPASPMALTVVPASLCKRRASASSLAFTH